jgi:cytosine deaminase
MTSPDIIDSLRQSPGWLAALEEARQGFSEGGLPVGACVVSKTGKILGRGHNMLVQNGTPQMHVCLSTPNDSFISDIISELL